MFIFFDKMEIYVFIVAAFIAVYRYLTNTFDYWRNQNVVYEKPYPLLGTVKDVLLLKEHPGIGMQKLCNRYPNEKVIGGFISRQPLLIVRDPDVIKDMFVKYFNYFQDHGFNPNMERELLFQHLFLLNGDAWKSLRQKLTPTFTSGKMRNMFPLLIECGVEFKKYIEKLLSERQEPEIKELMSKFTTDAIGTCAFGIRMNSMNDEKAPFRVMGRKIFDPSVTRALKSGLLQISPWLYNVLKLRITEIDVEKFFINLVKSVMQIRNYEASSRHDFIDLLMELKASDSAHIKITDELLTAQAFIFFSAGFETSSTTMTLALFELAKNQIMQKRLLDEIDKVINKHGRPTYEGLQEMTYLKMIVNETLRKYPPVLILSRICTSPYNISGTDIKLRKGVLVNVPLYALHHDPKYFPEPDKFIPERFTDEMSASRNPFVFMPFGQGPRVCIAVRFAILQTMMGIVSLLENYKVEVNERTVARIKISPTTFTLCSEDGIYLNILKRNNSLHT